MSQETFERQTLEEIGLSPGNFRKSAGVWRNNLDAATLRGGLSPMKGTAVAVRAYGVQILDVEHRLDAGVPGGRFASGTEKLSLV